MRLKSYLRQISPLLSNPAAIRRLLRLVVFVLSIGILSGAYNFLLFAFNNDVSQRRGYMSSAIAEAHTFFTNRQALLKSLSLSAVRKSQQATPMVYQPSTEEVHLQLGGSTVDQWSIWLTRRMSDYMREKRVSLLYVSSDERPSVMRLYNSESFVPVLSPNMLKQFKALGHGDALQFRELWLTDQAEERAFLYIFMRLDERDAESGWLGMEMDAREVAQSLGDHSAGEFIMLNGEGMPVFSNSSSPELGRALLNTKGDDFFGFIGSGLLPEQLVIRKNLKSSDWRLVYSIDLLAVVTGLWKQLLGSLLFCVISISSILLLMRRMEQRLIAPALHRIEALIESEAFSRDVIDAAPVALCVLRRSDGQMVLENHLAQQWLGACVERERLCAGWLQHAFQSPDAVCRDCFETVDGRHLHLSSVPTRYKGEDVLLCAFSDITTRKQVEAALEQARQFAEAANEAKTLFLATMSHEIRTPLYGLLGTLELLSRTELNSQQTDYLQAIEGSSGTLLQLICDVLDVSKIEAGQLVLEMREFSPSELVHEVIHSYTAAALGKGLQIYACIDTHLPARLIGDVTRIRQILNNLLSNAVKFTDCGRVVLRVVLLQRDGERSCVSWQVSDTGKGIAKADQSSIFEPFFQAEGNSHVIAGTGLGLPICQRLTQLMNGQMRMVSELGLGTSVTLVIPLEVVTNGDMVLDPSELLPERIFVVSAVRELAENVAGWLRRWGARPHIGNPPDTATARGQLLIELHPGRLDEVLVPDWSGRRILVSADGHSEPECEGTDWRVNLNYLSALHHVVSQAQGVTSGTDERRSKKLEIRQLGLHLLVAEDNIINQLILKSQLEELGCTVALANDGEEALQRWRHGTFDVVLTDVNMPRMNGYELAKALRRNGCQVPIIGATANAMRGEEELCLAAGMNQCLVKPLSLLALSNCLAPHQGILREPL